MAIDEDKLNDLLRRFAADLGGRTRPPPGNQTDSTPPPAEQRPNYTP